MAITLEANAYGEYAVNLSKIIRHTDYHEFRHISVNVQLQGEFEKAYTQGDNSKILPTDTQKNIVYALAKEHFTSSIEAFAMQLTHYFLSNNSQVTAAKVKITEHGWGRMVFDGELHPHAFLGEGPEKRVTIVEQNTNGITVKSGIKDLLVLKTTDSGFENFIKDQFTILKETSDRVLATQCEATWEYSSTDLNFSTLYHQVRETILHTFAFHKSLSVQQTLYAIGEQVLKEYDTIQRISLNMPNKHHFPFNLEQFGMENQNEIFMSTDEPFGYFTGTVVRE